VARSPGEAPEVNHGSVGQGGCGGGSPVRPVTDEGVKLKMGGGVLRQSRHMVTSGGRGGLQQCSRGQGGVGGLRHGASRAKERQGEGEGKGGGGGDTAAPRSKQRGGNGAGLTARRGEGGCPVWGRGGCQVEE
jgi:hypothetical protein